MGLDDHHRIAVVAFGLKMLGIDDEYLLVSGRSAQLAAAGIVDPAEPGIRGIRNRRGRVKDLVQVDLENVLDGASLEKSCIVAPVGKERQGLDGLALGIVAP
jgi:hypothetical protein